MITNIKHRPLFDTEKVKKTFADRDESVRYVCTTELNRCNFPIDVYIREDGPHPEFGNRYFGLYAKGDSTFICDADSIETLEFACVQSTAGLYHYSQYQHDFHKVDEGIFIDGGRAYTRIVGSTESYRIFVVRDGYFVPIKMST